jgi:putative mRNA 3-end processing factor
MIYMTTRDGLGIPQSRLGLVALIEPLDYGLPRSFNGVEVSLHPAGHILGSAQVRLAWGGEVWVVTGDFKLASDPTCRPFEPLACDTLVTESTFGLPIYRWQSVAEIFDEINSWWRSNASAEIVSLVFAYSLGKAQRLIAGLDADIGPIYCHGAVERVNRLYREAGASLPPTVYTGDVAQKRSDRRAIVVAPTSARGSPWLRRFGSFSSAFASGWMRVRGARRRRAVDRGFALSDHADWPGLIHTVRASGASRVLVTHGFVDPLVRWLNENGVESAPLHTEYRGELDESAEPPAEAGADAP